MSYSSPIFLFLYLPLVLTGYLLLRGQPSRNGLLLVASLVFYAWGEGLFVALLLASIAVNHRLGLWAGQLRAAGGSRRALWWAVVVNLALLGGFKYTGFAVENLNPLLGLLGLPALPRPGWHLPVGLSFFTFQAMSYVFDIHLGRSSAQRNPLHTALYIASFPQLLLGPIVRYRHIAAELTRRVTTAADFGQGANRFVIGLGKKVLIADTLAIGVDAVYALPPEQLSPGLAWAAVAGFTLQLYFDFSAYSDMAIGLGRMFGFHFRENFNYPLTARSRADFFRRWNISLFSWMRDYVFVPLCGRNCPFWRQQLNVMIMFGLVGLWHGPTWLFVLWGTGNGLLIVLEQLGLRRVLHAAGRPAQHGYTLLVTMVSLILLRAPSLERGGAVFLALFGLSGGAGLSPAVPHPLDGMFLVALAAGALGAMPLYPLAIAWRRLRVDPWLAARPGPAAAALLLPGVAWHGGILLVSAAAVSARTYTPFVYFQF